VHHLLACTSRSLTFRKIIITRALMKHYVSDTTVLKKDFTRLPHHVLHYNIIGESTKMRLLFSYSRKKSGHGAIDSASDARMMPPAVASGSARTTPPSLNGDQIHEPLGASGVGRLDPHNRRCRPSRHLHE
jgi:hypothetical protein